MEDKKELKDEVLDEKVQAETPQQEAVEPPTSEPTFFNKENPKKYDKEKVKKVAIYSAIVAAVLIIILVILLVSLKSCKSDDSTSTTPAASGQSGNGGSGNGGSSNGQTTPYSVTFVDWNGTVLKAATSYESGTLIANIVLPTNPTRAADTEYSYYFDGWEPALENVSKDITYTAKYTRTAREAGIQTVIDGAQTQLETLSGQYEAKLAYDDSKGDLDALNAEYYDKISNAATSEEVQDLIDEFKDEAEKIIAADIQQDPDFTVNEKNRNVYLTIADVAKKLTQNTPTAQVDFSEYTYDLFNGITGGTVDITEKAIVLNNETLTINYLTKYELERLQIDFGSDTDTTQLQVKYYSGDDYHEVTAEIYHWGEDNYYTNISGGLYSEAYRNDDGQHPITITGTGKVTCINTKQNEVADVTGKLKSISFLMYNGCWFSYTEGIDVVTAADILDEAVRYVEVMIVSNEDGKTYGAKLDKSQYTATLIKNGVKLENDAVLTTADSWEEGDGDVYHILIELIDESIPLVRSTCEYSNLTFTIQASQAI